MSRTALVTLVAAVASVIAVWAGEPSEPVRESPGNNAALTRQVEQLQSHVRALEFRVADLSQRVPTESDDPLTREPFYTTLIRELEHRPSANFPIVPDVHFPTVRDLYYESWRGSSGYDFPSEEALQRLFDGPNGTARPFLDEVGGLMSERLRDSTLNPPR